MKINSFTKVVNEDAAHITGDCPWCGSKEGKRNKDCGFCWDDDSISRIIDRTDRITERELDNPPTETVSDYKNKEKV